MDTNHGNIPFGSSGNSNYSVMFYVAFFSLFNSLLPITPCAITSHCFMIFQIYQGYALRFVEYASFLSCTYSIFPKGYQRTVQHLKNCYLTLVQSFTNWMMMRINSVAFSP